MMFTRALRLLKTAAGAGAAALALLSGAHGENPVGAPSARSAEAAATGELVVASPQTPALSWMDREGVRRRPADLGGGWVLVHFWATWCGVCRTELPTLDALQADMGAEGLRVAAVSLDRLGWPVVDRLISTLPVTHLTFFHDLNREASQAMRIAGLPATVLLDPNGREAARVVGAADWSDAALREKLRALMRR
jgi:thiol-disulfide isomerase/thioredoxin